jgi:uncharacterized protein YceK
MNRSNLKLLIAVCVMLTLVGCASSRRKRGGEEGKKGQPETAAQEAAEQAEKKEKAEAKKNAELKKKMDQAMNALNNVNNGGLELVPGGIPDAAPVVVRANDGQTLLVRQSPEAAPALNNPAMNPTAPEQFAVRQPAQTRGLSSTNQAHEGANGRANVRDRATDI